GGVGGGVEVTGMYKGRFPARAKQQPPDIAFVSAVIFKSGLRFDGAAELAKLARPDGPWVVLDLYHSFMALPSDFSGVANAMFLIGGCSQDGRAGARGGTRHGPPRGWRAPPHNSAGGPRSRVR